MLLPSLAIIGGIALLVWSADKFVVGAATFAHNMGMSTLMVGLTIVALGTSAPEILVSSIAALTDASALAVGNALGSNIANIALVLGVTALVSPLPVHSNLPRKELPLLLIATFASLVLLFDLELSRWDGTLLILGLITIMTLIVRMQRTPQAPSAEVVDEADNEIDTTLSTPKALALLAAGLILLVISSRVLVWGATEVALSLGVSNLVIGLTIVAIGTSLPELAASIASALKGHHDMAVGNIIGSNLFNLLAVMSMPALINPFSFEPVVLTRDYLTMATLTLLLAAFCFIRNRQGQIIIGRAKGLLLAGLYVGYMAWLYASR